MAGHGIRVDVEQHSVLILAGDVVDDDRDRPVDIGAMGNVVDRLGCLSTGCRRCFMHGCSISGVGPADLVALMMKSATFPSESRPRRRTVVEASGNLGGL